MTLARFKKTTPEWFLPAPEIPDLAEIDDYNNQIDCVELAGILEQLGEAAQSESLLESLEKKIDPGSFELLAAVRLLQGNEQESLRWLNQMDGFGSATFDRWHGAAIWEPILDLPQAKEFFDLADDHLRDQMQSIREMEASDQLAPLPSI
jgi:hypothetical protein